MQKQGEDCYRIDMLRLKKIRESQLDKEIKEQFDSSLENSMIVKQQKQIKMQAQHQSQQQANRFVEICKDNDIVKNQFIRVAVNEKLQEYYLLEQQFDQVYMGDELYLLLNVVKNENKLKDVQNLELKLEILNQTKKQKNMFSKVIMQDQEQYKLVFRLKVEEVAEFIFHCFLKQFIKEVRQEMVDDGEQRVMKPVIKYRTMDQFKKFRLKIEQPFDIGYSIVHQNGKFLIQVLLNNRSKSNTVYFQKIEFKPSEKEIKFVQLDSDNLDSLELHQQDLYAIVYEMEYDLKQEQQNKQLYLGDLLLLWKYCGSYSQQVVFQKRDGRSEDEKQKVWLGLENNRSVQLEKEEQLRLVVSNRSGGEVSIRIESYYELQIQNQGLFILGLEQDCSEYQIQMDGSVVVGVNVLATQKGIQQLGGIRVTDLISQQVINYSWIGQVLVVE